MGRKLLRATGVSIFAAAATYGGLAVLASGSASAYGPINGGSGEPVVSSGALTPPPVPGSSSSSSSSLAFTGTDAVLTTVAGAGAIGAGGALVLVSRRRRVHQA